MARILIADDEPMVRETVRTMLERAGHTVLTARDGSEALAILARSDVDVMVLDVIMPGKEGIETLIEAHNEKPHVSVIVMSGGGRAGRFDYLNVAKRLGAAQTLRKPFSYTALLEAVNSCLAAQPSDGAAP